MTDIRTQKLGSLCSVLAGGTPSRSKSIYWNGDIPWVKISDMLQGRIRSTDESISQEGLENSTARLLPKGTLLLSIFATIGRTAVLEIEAATNQAIVGLTPKRSDEIDTGYLRRHLEAQVSSLVRQGRGGAQSNINGAILKDLDIPLPPLDEQKRIAAVLDKADALRRQRQESLQLTEKLLQSVFIDMFGDPESMPQKKLAELLTKPLRNGLSPASGGLYADTVFTLSAITRGYFNSQARKEAMFATTPRPASRVNTTDFLICRGNGNLRLCGKGQFPTDDAIGVVFPDTIIAASIDVKRVAKAYFETLWNQPFVRRQIENGARTSNGIHKVNQTTLEEIKIPLPDFDAQLAFGQVVGSIVSSVKDLEASAEHMDNLFLGLQQRAFRGELDLSRLTLDPEVELPTAAITPGHSYNEGVFNRPGYFIAPREIEARMLALENRLDSGPGDSIPWSEDYFKYRTLSQLLKPPFSFTEIWDRVYYDMADASYETVKEKIFEYVAAGLLEQRFDEKRKEIVFYPRP
jgi:type I restriction enzyme S subunit